MFQELCRLEGLLQFGSLQERMREGVKLWWLHLGAWPMGAAQRTRFKGNANKQRRGFRGVWADSNTDKVHFLKNSRRHLHSRMLQELCRLDGLLQFGSLQECMRE